MNRLFDSQFRAEANTSECLVQSYFWMQLLLWNHLHFRANGTLLQNLSYTYRLLICVSKLLLDFISLFFKTCLLEQTGTFCVFSVNLAVRSCFTSSLYTCLLPSLHRPRSNQHCFLQTVCPDRSQLVQLVLILIAGWALHSSLFFAAYLQEPHSLLYISNFVSCPAFKTLYSASAAIFVTA